MNNSTIIVTIILIILTCALPRRYFLISFVVGVCFIPFDQRIIIADLDFTPLRICIVFAVIRLLLRGEQTSIQWNRFDKMFFVWAICGAVVFVIQRADMNAVINRTGVLFDSIGLYCLFRQNIRSWNDLRIIVKMLSVCALISAALVIVERVTQHNPFTLLGTVATGFHRGRYRCRGSFEHSIILGVFWANLVPIFFGHAIGNRSKMLYWLTATAACILIVIASGSSTPIVVLLWILLLLSLFRYRHYSKEIALGFLGILLAIHFIRDKPVWHLIARIKIVRGSTGYHRYNLIDKAIKHFDEWALLGTRNTTHWGYGLGDVTNHYIGQGVSGGLITVVLLIIVLTMATMICGKYSLLKIPKEKQWLGWAFCISVLGHAMSFLGVTYFGKMPLLLSFTLAIVGMIYNVTYNSLPVNQFASSLILTHR